MSLLEETCLDCRPLAVAGVISALADIVAAAVGKMRSVSRKLDVLNLGERIEDALIVVVEMSGSGIAQRSWSVDNE